MYEVSVASAMFTTNILVWVGQTDTQIVPGAVENAIFKGQFWVKNHSAFKTVFLVSLGYVLS